MLRAGGNDMRAEPLRTACYGEHLAAGGKMVDFHGFELPIWYSSIKEEHLATRAAAGLFDVSHMGSFTFRGVGLKAWLESISTQRVTALEDGRCAYTHFLDEAGYIIDDMIFAVVSDEEILGVPNATMISTMWQWFNSHLPSDGSISIEDLSPSYSILALQGPASQIICKKVLGKQNLVGRFRWQRLDESTGFSGWIQGTGYTGEMGFEIFIPNEQAPHLWRSLLSKGAQHGLVPVGLGARDTLRLEKGYLLSGQDFLWPALGDAGAGLPSGFLARNSWQTNIPFGLDMDHEFIGKEALIKSTEDSSCSRWWGLTYMGKGPMPRPGKAVCRIGDEEIIGFITSGGPSPSLSYIGIGMAYLKGVEQGDKVEVKASERKRILAEVTRPPFL